MGFSLLFRRYKRLQPYSLISSRVRLARYIRLESFYILRQKPFRRPAAHVDAPPAVYWNTTRSEVPANGNTRRGSNPALRSAGVKWQCQGLPRSISKKMLGNPSFSRASTWADTISGPSFPTRSDGESLDPDFGPVLRTTRRKGRKTRLRR